MTANTTPIYGLTPNTTVGGALTAANTAYDGTGTVLTVYTAGANGGLPTSINFAAAGSNVATVASIFINNGSTNTSAANNTHLTDYVLAASTASNTASVGSYALPWTWAPLPAGYKINVALRTAVSAGWAINANGMDY